MLRERMLTLLGYIFQHVGAGGSIKEASVRDKLLREGYESGEIDAALGLIEGQAVLGMKEGRTQTGLLDRPVRILHPMETVHMTMEAQGMLIYLDRLGLISEAHREKVLERVCFSDDPVDKEELNMILAWVFLSEGKPSLQRNILGLLEGPQQKN